MEQVVSGVMMHAKLIKHREASQQHGMLSGSTYPVDLSTDLSTCLPGLVVVRLTPPPPPLPLEHWSPCLWYCANCPYIQYTLYCIRYTVYVILYTTLYNTVPGWLSKVISG